MKIRKKTAATAEISTASMPDIVFLLLFFFMVTATIKVNEEQLNVQIPNAHSLTSVDKKFLIKELFVGIPKDSKLGASPRISANNKLISLDQIAQWVQEQKSDLGEVYKDQLIVMLKADEHVDMGLIGDIQMELRKNNARKILYRTLDHPLNY
ncbi:Biopolymer transport protein ExbD [Reichenbachiella faecimaris]|uniref:Biopolymer transport protein ExbD n=1 Tax=Reichenbachiella faecimaris TaxID=692418 RepID=A0A1W2G4Z3_REIFA|nr:biopolymer transporter ExbD [Reichenbachiella faecimaris]SMD31747.1 Biopolymer transport protein ExbD [Reichenbachiella faecimaris]